jgi:predicted nucleic acid-binding protein
MSDYLIFVDTNILLDFYRAGWESGLNVLKRFDEMHDRLITTYQVEMEFKKNRQGAILDTREKMNWPDNQTIRAPGFLKESQALAVLNEHVADSKKRIKRLQARLDKVLANPTTSDPVYRVVQRLFRNDSSLNLKRNMPVRRQLKRAAFRRFVLGYPPRKANDTSMGDALNWEWIVHVALGNPGKHVAIVSRDRDFGVKVGGRSHMNDWLIQEFRDRVSKKRQCLLFDLLSPAFELAGIKVAKKVRQEEREFAHTQSAIVRSATGVIWAGSTVSGIGELLRQFPKSYLAEPPPPVEQEPESGQDET